MANGDKRLKKATQQIKDRKKGKRDVHVPLYSTDGKLISPEKARLKRRILITVIFIVLIINFIYTPQFFMQEKTAVVVVSPDEQAIVATSGALRDAPSGDFDGDSLENSVELQFGTDPWNEDTDGDGASDWYEIYVSDTDPLTASDVMVGIQKAKDEQTGKREEDAYSCGDCILWPDDMDSRSHGGIVETVGGYKVCRFNGYVKFNTHPGEYAYKVTTDPGGNTVRTLLPYVESADAWKVSDGDYVKLESTMLRSIDKLTLFGAAFYIDANPVTSLLAKILPDKGFVTGVQLTSADIEPDTSEIVMTSRVYVPQYDNTNSYRFTVNTNKLKDLSQVMEWLRQDKNVLVTFYNKDYGEYIGIVTGYDAEGDLIIYDRNGEYMGMMNVDEKIEKFVDRDNQDSAVWHLYYDYSFSGFDSRNGDRLCFFAVEGQSDISEGDDTEGFSTGVTESAIGSKPIEIVPSEVMALDLDNNFIYLSTNRYKEGDYITYTPESFIGITGTIASVEETKEGYYKYKIIADGEKTSVTETEAESEIETETETESESETVFEMQSETEEGSETNEQ